MVELVDTQDLKSCGPKRLYGFDSRPEHRIANLTMICIEDRPLRISGAVFCLNSVELYNEVNNIIYGTNQIGKRIYS